MANPEYANTPWWTNLLSILLTAIVSVVGTIYLIGRKNQPAGTPSASVGTFFTDTLTYIPHIMLLFGILADMLTYQGVYSIPSLIGLFSVLLNYFMKFFWAGVSDVFVKLKDLFAGNAGAGENPIEGAAAAVASAVSPSKPANPRTGVPGRNVLSGGGKFFNDYDGCSIQGLSSLRNPYAPQTLVFTATVFSYYIFDLIQNRGWANATAAIVVGGVLFFAEAAVIGNCNQGPDEPSRTVQAIASAAEGLLFGGVGYSVVQAFFPGRLPSTAVSPFPKKTPEDLTPAANGGFKDKDGNPYVCLPNGQCYPDLSTASARTAFASIAAANLGTGAPAVPEDCAATPSTPSE